MKISLVNGYWQIFGYFNKHNLKCVMTSRIWKIIAIVAGVFIFIPFLGFDYYVDDYPIGNWWEIFIKNSPSFEFRFHNPAQFAIEIEPFEKLNDAQKKEMRRYCRIRYWVDDISECYRLAEAALP